MKEPTWEDYYNGRGPRPHPLWCSCGECVRKGINQKAPSAPHDHLPGCRCDKCGGFLQRA